MKINSHRDSMGNTIILSFLKDRVAVDTIHQMQARVVVSEKIRILFLLPGQLFNQTI